MKATFTRTIRNPITSFMAVVARRLKRSPANGEPGLSYIVGPWGKGRAPMLAQLPLMF